MYEEAARLLVDRLGRSRRWRGSWEVPATSAISRVRAQLGPEPLRALFARVCRLVTSVDTVGGWWQWTAPRWTPRTPRTTTWFFGRLGSGAKRRARSRRVGS
ncbi:transposase domain-containing protein [Streptomyces sp. NPDC090499]|uniref:transposase domain-containing protein n=1 Tax=Streptomyces sp. NPDC090499 TaxID=3365965 RepID=UPI00381FE692